MGSETVNQQVYKNRYVANDRFDLGVPLEEIEKNGNPVQKKVAFIFDYDGDGRLKGDEVTEFNNSRFSIHGNKVDIYELKPNKGSKPKCTVDLKVQREDYDKKVAEYAKRQEQIENFGKELTKYGLSNLAYTWAERIENISTKKVNNVKTLCIETEDFVMEMPLDKNYKPKELQLTKGDYILSLTNFNGTLKIKKDAGYFSYNFTNSDCKVICSDGNEDRITCTNSKITVKTGDYADEVYLDEHGTKEYLSPGTRTFDTREKEKNTTTEPAKTGPNKGASGKKGQTVPAKTDSVQVDSDQVVTQEPVSEEKAKVVDVHEELKAAF